MDVLELIKNMDGRVWAEEFCKIAIKKGFDPSDVEDQAWLTGWFANAIMCGYDHGRNED